MQSSHFMQPVEGALISRWFTRNIGLIIEANNLQITCYLEKIQTLDLCVIFHS